MNIKSLFYYILIGICLTKSTIASPSKELDIELLDQELKKLVRYHIPYNTYEKESLKFDQLSEYKKIYYNIIGEIKYINSNKTYYLFSENLSQYRADSIRSVISENNRDIATCESIIKSITNFQLLTMWNLLHIYQTELCKNLPKAESYLSLEKDRFGHIIQSYKWAYSLYDFEAREPMKFEYKRIDEAEEKVAAFKNAIEVVKENIEKLSCIPMRSPPANYNWEDKWNPFYLAKKYGIRTG